MCGNISIAFAVFLLAVLPPYREGARKLTSLSRAAGGGEVVDVVGEVSALECHYP